jgi:hypothetical protein
VSADLSRFFDHLKALHRDIDAVKLTPALAVFRFALLHLEHLHGTGWLGSRKGVASPAPTKGFRIEVDDGALADQLRGWGLNVDPRLADRLNGLHSPIDLLNSYQLKGVREDSQEGLSGWLEGRYRLHLRFDIPAALEMLEAQTEGERFVTLLTDDEAQFRPIGRHAGALQFLLHDLEHAHKFFGDGDRLRGQIGFFRMIKIPLDCSFFNELTQSEGFTRDLAYLISDMNSHPVHLFKYLKAIVLEACKRNSKLNYDVLINDLGDLWHLQPSVRASALRINNPGRETPEDAEIINRFFMQRGSADENRPLLSESP